MLTILRRNVAPRALVCAPLAMVPGGAQQVMGDRCTLYPGGVRTERSGRHVCERAVDQIGEHRLDDRVRRWVTSAVDVGNVLLVKNG